MSAPLDGALGWLVGVGTGLLAPGAAPSLCWLGEVTAWATELVARGRMVPTLVRSSRASRGGKQGTARYTVRWVPAAIERQRLCELSSRMPGAVSALEPAAQSVAVCRSILNAAVDTVCRAGASRLVAPASAPLARTRSEVVEAVLAGLDGTTFNALEKIAAEVARDLEQWAEPATVTSGVRLGIRLDPPRRTAGGCSPSTPWGSSVTRCPTSGPWPRPPGPRRSRWRRSCDASSGCSRRCGAPPSAGARWCSTPARPGSS